MPKPKLTDIASIPEVIGAMTLDEKLRMLAGASACMTVAVPEMNIPALRLQDGATGVNSTETTVDYMNMHPELKGRFDWNAAAEIAMLPLCEMRKKYKDDPLLLDYIGFAETLRPEGKEYYSFPSGVNIGASWNPACAEQIGAAVGWELRSANIDICLGPNVDIQRDPLGGRNYEMYGEDPYLVGVIGSAFIRGMQRTGVGACAKHFLANNQETYREKTDNHVSERALREIYSPGFMKAVKEAQAKSIMSAYSCINGTFASYNRALLTDLLKKEWGFDGIVVSDWGAVNQGEAEAVHAGLDVILTGPRDMSVCKAVMEEGTITLEEIDDHVYRLLRIICELKEVQAKTQLPDDLTCLLDAACEGVAEGSVLLKNEANTLPLSRNEKIIFWGNASKSMMECGSGSTKVISGFHSNVFDESAKIIGEDRVFFEEWSSADTLIYTAAAQGGEGADRERMDLDEGDRDKLPEVLRQAKQKGLKTVVLLNVAGPVDLREWIDFADAVLCIFVPGCMGGKASAQMLFGDAAPSGRLPVTFPVRYEDTPAFPNFPAVDYHSYYGEGIFVGYRCYDKRQTAVQFPFGFGLSYSSFEQHADTAPLTMNLREQDSIQVPVSVTNTGGTRDSQVIQLYLRECAPHIVRPVKELKAFAKITLDPGETKELLLELKAEDLPCYDPQKGGWVTPVGAHQILLGTSSRDIFAEIPLTIAGSNPYAYGPDTSFSEILKGKENAAVLERYMPGVLANDLSILNNRTLEDALSLVLIGYVPNAIEAERIRQSIYQDLENLSR